MILSLCVCGDLVFAAHDLTETPSGDFYFLETNPAGQWGWLELTTGLLAAGTVRPQVTPDDGGEARVEAAAPTLACASPRLGANAEQYAPVAQLVRAGRS